MPYMPRTYMTQEIGLYRIRINTFPLQCVVTVLLVGQEVIYRIFDTACIYFFVVFILLLT